MPLAAPYPVVFENANQLYTVAESLPARKEIFIQVRGPGAAALSPVEFGQVDDVLNIQPGGFLRDQEHTGKWYGMSSVAGTRVIVQETI